MCDKIKRNLMMEYNTEEVYQRRKRQWLTYGRALLTIGILGLITVALFYISQNYSHSASKADEQNIELSHMKNNVEEIDIEQNQIKYDHDESINTNDIAIIHNNRNNNQRIINKVKRSSDFNLNNNSEQKRDVVVNENEIPKDNSENILVHDSNEKSHFRRQQSNNDVVHRHSDDNGVYIFKGFKCYPISKPSKQLENLRVRQRVGCNCHVSGSEDRVCNSKTGQCKCRPHVIGRTCDRCEHGYWNIDSKKGCEECMCNVDGSEHEICDIHSGECVCKNGVEGAKCDKCKSGYFGFSSTGCKKCSVCDSSLKVCDQETGRCVCPPLSHGTECQHCHPNTWGLVPMKGCKNCECNSLGSLKQSCDFVTGQCECKEGYSGRTCENCAIGYYGYPNCQKCNCDIRGSKIHNYNEVLECDENGQCPCKELVTGLKCNECRQSTFGLSQFNPNGCTRCFCFGRSQKCLQNDLIWGQVRLMGPRNVSLNYNPEHQVHHRYYVNNLHVIISHVKNNHIYRERAEISSKNGLSILPGLSGDITIQTSRAFSNPFYIELPKEFLGDKTSSYGGFLNFSLTNYEFRSVLDHEYLNYPLIQLHTHYHLTLNFYQTVEPHANGNSYSVILHESYWRHAANGYNISRAIMMTALQNIKHIFVRVTSSSDFNSVTLENATMSIGLVRNGNNNAAIASGIEKCECPDIYSGDSCQDPADGYYRWRNTTTPTNMLEDLVGRVVPCECSGRSDVCDKETGECVNCRENTGGFYCEKCAEGFYGHPDKTDCKPCPCPETNKKFAKGCFVEQHVVSCFCKEGYIGPLCDRCAKGYFGQPQEQDGKCESCDCNIEGIVSDECDYLNGQCNCKKGVTGRRCDRCELPRHLLIDYECQLCDNCTQTLLDSIDEMMYQLNINLDGVDLHNLKAPWYKLNEYKNATDQYSNNFDDFFKAVDAVDNFNDIASDELLLQSENLQNKVNRMIITADKKTKTLEELKTKSDELLSDSRELSISIQETIVNLESYGTSDHHIKLPIALKEARMYLDDITKKSKDIPSAKEVNKCANDQLEFWNDEMKNTKAQKEKLEKIIKDKEILQNRINDFKNLTHRAFRDSSETEAFITKNKNDFEKLKNKISELDTQALEVEELLKEDIVAASASRMESVHDNINKAEITNDDLLSLHDDVDKTVSEREAQINAIKNSQMIDAQNHAQDLSDRSKMIVNLFQQSKDGAQLAVRAGTAYSKIAESINAAKDAADKAHEAAVFSNQQLNPIDPDEETMLEKGNDLSAESEAIQQDAETQIKKINELNILLDGQQGLVKNMSSTIHNSGKLNNEMSSLITKLSNNAAKNSIKDSSNLIDNVLEDIKNIDNDVNEVGDNVSLLKEKLAVLDPEWDSKFGLAEEQVTKTLIDIREANRTWNVNEDRIKKQQERFGAWNDSISSKLQELRDKITKAKHAAENIRVSLESSDDSCVRSFYPPVTGVSISNHIVMTFALNSRNINSPLIFVQGDDGKFFALEMFNRKIYFIWNLGGDSGSIAHPLEIQTRDPKYDDAWYKVEISRNLNLGSLVVSKMTSSGTFSITNPVSGATSLNFTRFSISKHNRIYVGGVPDKLRPKEMQMKNGLSVIMNQIFIDDKQIGLWHFASSEGKCEGAMLGATESSDNSNSRYFTGNGYSVVHKQSSRPPRQGTFSLQITFRTLDENALLFLTVDEKNNRSISLTMHEGKLVFRIDYGDDLVLEINTTNRYNTGSWVSVEASREFLKSGSTENGLLKVNNDDEYKGSPSKPVTKAMLPNVSRAPFYIGGVSPDFKSGTTKAPGADNGFIGCMRDIHINDEMFDPLESHNFYGIEPTCQRLITKVGFYGNGYLEMPSHSFRAKGNMGFVFRTLQPDCLLLFSGFPPQAADDYDGKDERGNFSISLINGNVVFWVDAGKGRIELTSNLTFNDGEFHVIHVNKNRKKFELRVDDNLEAFKSFHSPTRVNSPEEYGLFLGGAPDFPEFDNVVPTFNGLRGAIKDLVFNNQTISFDTAINYKSVNFGGFGPGMGTIFEQEVKTEPIAAKFKENKEGCQRVGSYSYETNAFKFGNSPHSYSMIQVQSRPIWHRNVNIQFDYRTFYPDGFLFAVPDARDKPKHYVYLYIRSGNVILVLRGRKREQISIPLKSNNGQWQHISIDVKNHLLTLTVSVNGKNKNESQKSLKIPKKFFASNTFFIGGLPVNAPKLHREIVTKKDDFKGCIRRFTVNGITQDLTRHFHNLGQCFPRIEKGSYFSGDAYAEFKNEFNVGKHLEIEMEFKTSELNGILLSISEPLGFPSLSIEISDGNLIMSCDFNNGEILRAVVKLTSKYSICDNKWHNISAFYDTHQIAIRIDDKESVVASSKNIGKLHTNSPLFIGGIPESSSPRSIIMRENFKGCIRNVKLNSGHNGLAIVDWIDMYKLHNVLLNECPR